MASAKRKSDPEVVLDEDNWAAMNRLFHKGMIHDPVGKAKSVVFTEEGLRRSEELLVAMLAKRR